MIHIPAVPYAIVLDDKIGYVPVQRFNETATEEVQAAVARLTREGVKGVILDMRGNPGGILDQSTAMSNLFLKDGQEIVSVRSRDQRRRSASRRPATPCSPRCRSPCSRTTARPRPARSSPARCRTTTARSSSAGTSFGKGLVQTLFPLDGGYALKITTAKWYTPSGRSIQRERKFENGKFVETQPDSLETEAKKKSRPAYRSDAGRIVYGGGGITPDILVRDDTLTTAEQTFFKSFAPKAQAFVTARRLRARAEGIGGAASP